MAQRFDRTKQLIGLNGVKKLSASRVAVFGIGGVGSFVCEGLARGGIGALDLFDYDEVDITNINRQIIALDSTVGKKKTDVMKERIMDINPSAKVSSNYLFISPESVSQLNLSQYDYIVDAIDNVTGKIALCEAGFKANIPVISAMGAGNRLEADGFKIADISKTSGCPLAKVMRLELKKRGISGIKAAFSDRPAIKRPTEDGKRPTPASISFVPSVMGLLIAGEVIKDIIGKEGTI